MKYPYCKVPTIQPYDLMGIYKANTHPAQEILILPEAFPQTSFFFLCHSPAFSLTVHGCIPTQNSSLPVTELHTRGITFSVTF